MRERETFSLSFPSIAVVVQMRNFFSSSRLVEVHPFIPANFEIPIVFQALCLSVRDSVVNKMDLVSVILFSSRKECSEISKIADCD